MNTGETFYMSLWQFAQPMLGKLVEVATTGGEEVKARVMSIDSEHVKLAVVPKTTKE